MGCTAYPRRDNTTAAPGTDARLQLMSNARAPP